MHLFIQKNEDEKLYRKLKVDQAKPTSGYLVRTAFIASYS